MASWQFKFSELTFRDLLVLYAARKKTPNFAQGVDLLTVLQEKLRKTEEKTRKNLGTPGSYFL